jgi:hypothetical protein
MLRLLFTVEPGLANGPAPVLAHLTFVMTAVNANVRIESVYRHECGIILETNGEAGPYLPLDSKLNEELGTYRLPLKDGRKIRHTKVTTGYCPICGHHGKDCKGRKSNA